MPGFRLIGRYGRGKGLCIFTERSIAQDVEFVKLHRVFYYSGRSGEHGIADGFVKKIKK